MFDELTPEQRCELLAYSASEPFGEVRADMRMAKLIQFYYESNRSKNAKPSKLGAFMLYSDYWPEAESQGASEADLLNALGGTRGG